MKLFSPWFSVAPCEIIILVFIFFSLSSNAQTPDSTGDDERSNLLEQQATNTDAQGESYEYVEELAATLHTHPLNLDNATEDDLQQLVDIGLLSDLQVQSLLTYRKQFGKFLSIFELQAIPYWDLNTISNLLPYIRVTNDLSKVNISPKDIVFGGDYMFLFRAQQNLETARGFSPIDTAANDTNRYLGSKQKIYLRFRYSYGTKISYGSTMKKDAGEELFKGTQKNGFDFYSYHFFMRGNKLLKAIALGDYTLNFGQGLTMWGGFGIGKSAEVLSVKKGGRIIKPYTSSTEFNYFRGAAVSFGTKHFTATPFFSYQKLDANVSYLDTVSDFIIITSFGGDGYHRTYSELGNKDVTTQTTYGGNIRYLAKNFSAGVSAIRNALDVSEVIQRIYPYNQFSLNSAIMTNQSADYSWRISNLQLFGEAAMSGNGGRAILQGVQMSLNPKSDLSLVYRNFSREYIAPFAQAFSESSTPNNERGLYAGLQVRPSRYFTFNAYADLFQKSWLDYQVSAPSMGTDFFAQLSFKPSRTVELYVRFRDKQKEVNSPVLAAIDYLVPQHKQNLRFNISYKVNQLISVDSRVEAVRFKEGSAGYSHGILFLQDINFKKSGVPLSITARYSIFDTDNYDTRIYAFENDVLYSYSIPAFQGKGIRYYILLRYTANHYLDFWLRFAQTSYLSQNIIGSGLDEIDSNHKSEVKAEMRIRF